MTNYKNRIMSTVVDTYVSARDDEHQGLKNLIRAIEHLAAKDQSKEMDEIVDLMTRVFPDAVATKKQRDKRRAEERILKNSSGGDLL